VVDKHVTVCFVLQCHLYDTMMFIICYYVNCYYYYYVNYDGILIKVCLVSSVMLSNTFILSVCLSVCLRLLDAMDAQSTHLLHNNNDHLICLLHAYMYVY
jgi:hypothetical protein